MKRITKIVALAAIALFATAAVASAAVSVENGVGHVDKGDMQSALKWNNGDFDKNVGSLTFSAGTVTKVYNNSWICQDGTSYNQPRTQVLTQTLKATAVVSSNGKQITGWDLTNVGSTKVFPTPASRRCAPVRTSTSSRRSSRPPASMSTPRPAPQSRLAAFR